MVRAAPRLGLRHLGAHVEHGDAHGVEAGKEKKRGLGWIERPVSERDEACARLLGPHQAFFRAREAPGRQRSHEKANGKEEAR